MKRLMVLATLAALFLAGCATPPPCDPRVTIAPDVLGDVAVTDVRLVTPASGFSTFQALACDLTGHGIPVSWKAQWFDETGTVQDGVEVWQSLILEPGVAEPLKAVAPNANAHEAHIYIRAYRE